LFIFLGVGLEDPPTRYESAASTAMSTEPMTAASTTSRIAGVVRNVPRDPPTAATTTTTPTQTARHPPSTTPTSTTSTLYSILEDLRGDDVTILQKPLPTSPPGWRRQRKKTKAATKKEKHDFKNGKVLRKKFKVREAAINKEKHDFKIGEVLRKKFKDREIE
jgi:hypothetical protein